MKSTPASIKTTLNLNMIKTIIKSILTCVALMGLMVPVQAQVKKMKMTTAIPTSVSTPDKVETSIGTMNLSNKNRRGNSSVQELP